MISFSSVKFQVMLSSLLSEMLQAVEFLKELDCQATKSDETEIWLTVYVSRIRLLFEVSLLLPLAGWKPSVCLC